MEGVLFKWGSKGVHVGFRTPVSCPQRNVVLIGGLTDGLMPTPYTVPLARALNARGWGLVQTLLSSSHSGYGTSSLEQDAAELDELLGFLSRELQCSQAVLAGHSTGCQDIVHYLGRTASQNRALVKGAILQGPASDREFMATLSDTARWLALAEGLQREGRGHELMPRESNACAPITAERFLSLGARGGADDLFSSDLCDQELRTRLGHMAGTPTLVLFSESDEYVPSTVDKALLVDRLCKAMGAKGSLIPGADHALYSGQEEALAEIDKFIERIPSSTGC